jgi:heme exporter protein CcmD
MHWLVARHAAYVLAAYGLSAVVLIGLIAASLVGADRWRRAAQAQETRQGRP